MNAAGQLKLRQYTHLFNHHLLFKVAKCFQFVIGNTVVIITFLDPGFKASYSFSYKLNHFL